MLEAYAHARVDRPDQHLERRARLAGELRLVSALLAATARAQGADQGAVASCAARLRRLDEHAADHPLTEPKVVRAVPAVASVPTVAPVPPVEVDRPTVADGQTSAAPGDAADAVTTDESIDTTVPTHADTAAPTGEVPQAIAPDAPEQAEPHTTEQTDAPQGQAGSTATGSAGEMAPGGRGDAPAAGRRRPSTTPRTTTSPSRSPCNRPPGTSEQLTGGRTGRRLSRAGWPAARTSSASSGSSGHDGLARAGVVERRVDARRVEPAQPGERDGGMPRAAARATRAELAGGLGPGLPVDDGEPAAAAAGRPRRSGRGRRCRR